MSSGTPLTPTPPLLIAGDHLFEWIHSYHTFPAFVVLFTVNPLTHSPTPEVSVDGIQSTVAPSTR